MTQQSAARGRPAIISDDELLDVARAVFLDRGLDATTADVAERARVSTSLIFYRYKTKEALFAAVLERELSLHPFFESLGQRAGKGRVEDCLFDAGMVVVESLSTVLPLSMLAGSSTKLSRKMHELVKSNPARQRLMELLCKYLGCEIELGRLSRHEPAVIANAFVGGLVDYVLSQYFQHGTARPAGVSQFLRQLVSLLLDGCGGAKRTRPRTRRT